MASRGSTAAEQSPHYPKVEGSCPASTAYTKMAKSRKKLMVFFQV